MRQAMVRFLSLFTLFIVAFFSFSYGVLATRYSLFPYQQILYINKVIRDKPIYVMIGDSITAGGYWHSFFPTALISNSGISGNTTRDIMLRLDSITKTKPDNAFVMIGVNDTIQNIKVNEILNNYKHIIEALQFNKITPIIQSTLYVSKDYKSSDRINNSVKALNSYLHDYANKNGILFINLNYYLSNNEILRNDVTNDGVHLNENGYKIWKLAISGYIKQ